MPVAERIEKLISMHYVGRTSTMARVSVFESFDNVALRTVRDFSSKCFYP